MTGDEKNLPEIVQLPSVVTLPALAHAALRLAWLLMIGLSACFVRTACTAKLPSVNFDALH